MKKLILASAAASAFSAQGAHAADAAPAATPDHSVAINVGVVSDYRFRGITQTTKNPAANATIDYTHNPTGLYAGLFGSTIKWINDTTGAPQFSVSGNAPIEIDLYGGKRGDIGGGLSYDVGGILYYYPNNRLSATGTFGNANTVEAYGQLGYGSAYLKYSYALTDFVGNRGSLGSSYFDIGANQELIEGYVLNLHYGYQRLENTPDGSYRDWKVGITKDFGLAIAAVAYIDTNANPAFYSSFSSGMLTGAGTTVFSLSKNF